MPGWTSGSRLLTGGVAGGACRGSRRCGRMVDWSWELLTGAERAAAGPAVGVRRGVRPGRRRGGRRGPVTCPPGEVLGHLGALVDKSLVQFDDTRTGPGRYRLLETVRQYAAR